MSKEASCLARVFTPPVFLGIPCYVLIPIILRIGLGIEIDQFSIILLRGKWHTIPMRLRLTLWNMVKVPSSKKATTKEKALRWDQKGECSRSKSSSGNASTMGSKVTNLLIADFRRETNSRKPMWLTTSPRMCRKLTSLQ